MKILYAFVILCFISFSDTKSSSSSSSSSSEDSKIDYTYILWIGDNAEQKYSIHLESLNGIVFFDAMNQAAKKNSHFVFNSTEFPPYGKFVNAIDGVYSDKIK